MLLGGKCEGERAGSSAEPDHGRAWRRWRAGGWV